MVVQTEKDASFVSIDCTAIVAKIIVESAFVEQAYSSCIQVLQQEGSSHCVSDSFILEHLYHGLASLL